MVVGELIPVLAFNKSDDTPRRIWSPSVVLASIASAIKKGQDLGDSFVSRRTKSVREEVVYLAYHITVSRDRSREH
jgi:hypothetical protein